MHLSGRARTAGAGARTAGLASIAHITPNKTKSMHEPSSPATRQAACTASMHARGRETVRQGHSPHAPWLTRARPASVELKSSRVAQARAQAPELLRRNNNPGGIPGPSALRARTVAGHALLRDNCVFSHEAEPAPTCARCCHAISTVSKFDTTHQKKQKNYASASRRLTHRQSCPQETAP